MDRTVDIKAGSVHRIRPWCVDAANGGSVQVAVPVAEEKKREAKAGAFELKRLLAPHVGDYREASLAGLAQ